MRKILTIIVIVSFISVLFGSFISMAYGSTHAIICLATWLNGSEAPCPETDPIGFANFHGGALRNFSSPVVVDSSALLLMIASLGILMLSLLLTDISDKELIRLVAVSFFDSRSQSYVLRVGELNWLSLHENSPS